MTHKDQALQLFSEHFHCSQAVLAAFAPECGLSHEQALKLGACFGSGMRKGEVCGACTGALMVLGLLMPMEEVIERQLMGTGTPHPEFRGMLGDYLAIAITDLTIYFTEERWLYLGAYDNGFRSYDELFGIAYTWVEWLEYNIRRALGMEAADAQEQHLGEAEVKKTIERIRYLNSIEGDVREVLNSLPRLNPENYQTHDDRLCNIDLVFEGKLMDQPVVALPVGYRLVTYEPGDRDAWIDIEYSAAEVLSREHGEACWERYYGSREQELPGRMWFVENAAGEKVATATALYDIHGAARPGEGQLHWVAVKKEYQGRGLSKPLITYVLQVMKRLGYDSVKIHTQTNTWLACGIYYDLGFRPSPDSRVQNRFGWKMVEQLTGKEIRGGCPNSQMNTIEIGG